MKRAALLLLLAACRPAGAPSAASKPAALLSKEGDLVVVTLTEESEKRLGIRTAAVERGKHHGTRERGGEALVPPGASVTVSAPLAGTLGGEPPRVGGAVTRGQAVFTLTPFLSPESRASLSVSRVEAEGAVEGARVQVEAAKVEFARAEKLLEEKAGSRRAVDEARARKDQAEAARRSAEARRALLASAVEGTLGAMPAAVPFDGLLTRLHAAPGQTVGAGAALFEVTNLDRLWIRVPVYVGELARLDAAREITIAGRPAKPVAAPPAADSAASTADLVYEIDNKPLVLRPGQKVDVALPELSVEDAATLPRAAVLYDIHGGAWIYERIAAFKYVRRRVRIRRVDGEIAVLDGGPAAGTAVVVEGAAELFGTEFYVNK